MKRILLVSPVPLNFDLTQDEVFVDLPFLKKKTFLVPIHIATIAALTPDHFEVDLWDEPVHGRIDDCSNLMDYDLVGVTGFTTHLPRAKEIAQVFRKREIPVAVGGPGISTIPQRYRDDFDIFFLGEAELTWPQFLEDWKKGGYRKVYRQIAGLDLALSPLPRWDCVADQMHNYFTGAVQTSRGCPFACEFCDVSHLFGRRYRHKPIDRVLEEIVALEKLGMESIAFCDDNFIGNPRYTRELLRELIPLNNSFLRPLRFATEMSINVADNEELLELLADANFCEVHIGIESPNQESLKETNKLQNYRRDLVEDIRRIQSYGLPVRAGMIVGFDHDSREIFDLHIRFAQEACIPVPSIRVLMAPPGTRLWKRLLKEGRLIKTDTAGRYFGNPGNTNVIPKLMTRLELFSGYLDLIERIYQWESFAARIKGFISSVKRQPNVPKQKYRWKNLFQFLRFLFGSLDRKSRRVIIDIVQYTREQAPFMMTTVIGAIFRHFGYVSRPLLRDAVRDQMEKESSEGFKMEIEQADLLSSEVFEEIYEEIFPEIYEKVYSVITNKSFMEEALVEIFTEFVAHWGNILDSFFAEHRVHLMELADRIIAERNRFESKVLLSEASTRGTESITLSPLTPGSETMSNLQRAGLSDEILKAVEQELLMQELGSGGQTD